MLRSVVMLAFVVFHVTGVYGKAPANDTCNVQIIIRPVYKGAPLKTGNQYYVNALGDTFYIDEFRFYISNVRFSGSHEYPATNSHLFDLADTATYSYSVAVPHGVYQYMHVVIGVDSIANTSGANEGDLDPMKGMYWAWNSGYIMAKLEGHSKACLTLHHAFEFHIGGYMTPYNTQRTVSLNLREPLDARRPQQALIILYADVAKWLNDIDLSKTNSVLIPGKEAMMMADKYIHMVSVAGISYQPVPPR